MLSISLRLESLTIDIKHTFQLMDQIQQSKYLPPSMIIEEKTKEVFMLKKHKEKPQQAGSANAPKTNIPSKCDAHQKQATRLESFPMKKP